MELILLGRERSVGVTVDQLKQEKIVSIIRMSSIDRLDETVEALYKGGIRAVEITTNTKDAPKGISRTKELFPEMLVGAGTVLDSESVNLVISAGADFILTPTLKKETIESTNRYQVPIIPGAFSPTEVLTAVEYGASIVKVFPARQVGPGYFSDLRGPLPHIQTMAVGGINLENANSYLNAGASMLGVGSSLVDEALVQKGDFDEIERRANRFVEIVQNAK